MKTILNIITKGLLSMAKDKTVLDAAVMMREKKIGAVLVHDEKGELCGIFTERDFVTRIDFKNPCQFFCLQLQDVMTSNLICADVNQSYEDVIRLMRAHHIRHIPVKQDGRVIGIVSLRGLMRHYETFLEHTLQEKEKQLLENIKQIRQSEKRFFSIFHNSAHAIIFADPETKIITSNPMFETITEYSPEELSNKTVQDFFPEDEWAKLKPQEIRQRGGKLQAETKIYNKHRELIDINFAASVLEDEAGQVSGYIGMFCDIRERKQAEEILHKSRRELERANQALASNTQVFKGLAQEREKALMKLKRYQEQIIQMEKMATLGTLAVGFAHGVKNPLGVMLQGLERIELVFKKQGNESDLKYLEIVKKAALRANEIVQSLLRYSRSSQLEIENFNIYRVLDEAVDLIESQAHKKQVRIIKNYAPDEHLMQGDKVMLQQVFFDIMTNAIHAMSQGGNIIIGVEYHMHQNSKHEEDTYIIQFRDEGSGIKKEHLSKIFDPFFTTKDEGEGTGLGLSTAYMIIERHNGEIFVNSKPGEGTTFTIVLPLRGAQEIKGRYKYV